MATPCPPDPLNPPEVAALFGDGQPEDRIDRDSPLCSIGNTPERVTGEVLQFLRQYFCDINNIMSPDLRRVLQREGLWARTPTGNSGLLIESLGLWDPARTEGRSGVVIKAGDWNRQIIGIGDQMGETLETGAQHYTSIWQGTHTIFCLGVEDRETAALAGEIATALTLYGPVLADSLKMKRLLLVTRGGSAALKESKENYVMPLTLAYSTQFSWTLTPEAPLLKNIHITAR